MVKKRFLLAPVIFLFLCIINEKAFSDSNSQIDACLSISTGHEIITYDYIELLFHLAFTFDILSCFTGTMAINADMYTINTDEISIQFSINDILAFKTGTFKNFLTIDGILSPEDSLFSSENILSYLIKNKGLISNSLTFSVFHKINNEKPVFPISFFLTIKILSKKYIPQIDAIILYHFNTKSHFFGLTGSYCPAYYSTSLLKDATVPLFFINAFLANFGDTFIYGCETGFGTTIIDSISIVLQPFVYDKPTFFCAADLFTGIRISMSKYISWIPILRCSIFFPEISQLENLYTEIICGNKFTLFEYITLHIDGGLRITNALIVEKLYMRILPFWELTVTTRI